MSDKLAMLENLFKDQEEYSQENGIEVPSDSSQWTQAVLQEAFNTVPIIANFKDSQVNFNKVDEEKGYAIGSITVRNEKAQVNIPVLIKNFVLAPLDVFIDNDGKFRPITEERLKVALFNPDISAELVRPEDQSIFGTMYPGTMGDMVPPTGGSYSGNRVALASNSILNSIISTIADSDRDKVASILKSSPETVLEFAISGKAAMVDKVLNSAQTKTAAIKDNIDSTWYDIFQVSPTENRHEVIVKMASSEWNDPVIERMTVRDMQKLADQMAAQGQPGLQQAAQAPGATVAPAQQSLPQTGPENYIDTEACMRMTPVDQPAFYKVMSVMGEKLVGYCYPMILDFNLQPMPAKLFVGMGQLAIQEEIIGEMIDFAATPPEAPITQGGTYVLAFHGEQKGQALALTPVQIMQVAALDQQVAFLAVDVFNQIPVALFPMRGLETVMPATPEMLGELGMLAQQAQAAFFVPGDIKGIAITGQTQLISHPQEAMQIMQMGGPAAVQQMQEQQAAQEQQMAAQQQPQDQAPQQAQPQQQKTSSVSGRVVYDHPIQRFWIDSPLVKVACDNLTADDAIFALVASGANLDDVNGILKQAYEKGECRIYNLKPPASIEHDKAMRKEASAHLEEIVSDIRRFVTDSFVKVAALIPEEEDADAVLSLNFMNQDNLEFFKKALPKLDIAESVLASLIMSIRLGQKNVPERLVKDCMTNLSDIIDKLKEI